jgi:subtilisin-like proprotein convertase family protein
VTIPDADITGIASTLSLHKAGAVKDIVVAVDIEHSYIGDLQVELVAPSGHSALLHDKEGDWRHNIIRSFDVASTPALQMFIGESISGDWQLRVRDLARADQGQLNTWSLKIWY